MRYSSGSYIEWARNQGGKARNIIETLDIAWGLLGRFPEDELRIDPELVRRFAPKQAADPDSP